MRHRNFRLYFAGQSISLIGTWMTRIATSWLVYRLTGSPLLLGLVGFMGQIPTFLLAPIAGVIVDRMDRRTLLVWTQALAMVQSLALAVLTLTHRINITEVLCLSVMQGLINAFDMPGRQSFMIKMVEGKADLSNAIAINLSMVNVARLIGPSLAGLIIAASNEGWCFTIDGVSYIAVIVSLLAMRIPPGEDQRESGSLAAQMREGWAYVSASVPIRTILLLFAPSASWAGRSWCSCPSSLHRCSKAARTLSDFSWAQSESARSGRRWPWWRAVLCAAWSG